MKEADISDFVWHDLRHSTASYLAMNGATLAEIAQVLGHKTLAMVKRYAHTYRSGKFGVKSQIALSSGNERETQHYHRARR
jgi:integrase